jgi:hypothetical protein
MNYEYVFAGDVFKDDNHGLKYGVESVEDFPDYIEWFPSIEKLEANTKKNKFNVVNRERFLNYIKKNKY